MIEAEIVCDSIAKHSPRLTTFLAVFPAFIEQELLRHRAFSFSSSSSRAIPVTKNLEEVRSASLRAYPERWPAERKGMQGGDDLDADAMARALNIWDHAASDAAYHAERLARVGTHKSITNRILGPYIHRRMVITSCEPGLMNFFGLRLDRAAQPEIRVLAERMWRVWGESTPQRLEPGQWHLPFIDNETLQDIMQRWVDEQEWPANSDLKPAKQLAYDPFRDIILRVSAARCARVSYLSFETGRRSTVEEDLRLYDRLAGSQPMHLSPLEQQATPDMLNNTFDNKGYCPDCGTNPLWDHPEQHGNLPGWRQFRKMIPGEAIAPLPEGYSL